MTLREKLGNKVWRKTTQHLAPLRAKSTSPGNPDIYPAFPLGPGKMGLGFDALAQKIKDKKTVIIDGYGGVFWGEFQHALDASLRQAGVTANWYSIDQALLPEEQIQELVNPFLGGDDPLFGKRITGHLQDFYDLQKLANIQPDDTKPLNIVYGCGAALAGWDGYLIYVDLPKNEIQFRSRAGTVRNLGTSQPRDPKVMYKRFYFVDWIILNKHKADLLNRIDLVVDEQRPDEIVFMDGSTLREGLQAMSRNFFRVRPWFEPGPWGGQWIKQKMPELSQEAVNYAWSFELIVPENGLMFASDGIRLEVSFDFLMYHDHRAILGDCAEPFGHEFPIRFDFLDTFDGGNLSVQCHPRPEYVKKHFGENSTQDETYYIVDCGPDAKVYLGFRGDINPDEYRSELEKSFHDATPVDIEKYVNTEKAHKHDLFLIPNGTIHCSGKDCLVLEISATPYIFTFKMYDWMRLDLDGRPRPLNIARAFENLYFDRKGKEKIEREFVSHPQVIADTPEYKLIHCPTHPAHFYDVHRYEFEKSVEILTENKCHVLMLVEGTSILMESSGGLSQRFNYAETFVVPAAAEKYRLINEGPGIAKVVKAFVK